KEKYLREADLFVFPTYYNNECFPLVLLEAMEYSLPCISTNEGGITDIIEESKTGYIVEKQNPKILAQQIEYLLDHPELRKQMGQAGKNKFQKEFTLEKFEERMKTILEEVI
ncbi:glycosyltransferase, partial [Bacteroides fragilis]